MGGSRQLLSIKNWQYNPILAYLNTPLQLPPDPTIANCPLVQKRRYKWNHVKDNLAEGYSMVSDSCATILTILFST